MLVRPGSVGRLGQPQGTGLRFALDATAEQIRAAIADISTYGYAPHNLLTYSEALDNAAWTKSAATVSADAVVAPNGTTTADTLIPSATNAQHYATRTYAGLTAGTPHVFSVHARAAGRNWLWIYLGGGGSGSNCSAYFDLATGAVGTVGAGATASITPLGGGWYRCAVFGSPVGATLSPELHAVTANDVVSNTGDAVNGVSLWGHQLHLGPTLLTYIPTTTTAVGPTTPGFRLPGSAGLRINASARASVAMERQADGTYRYAAHNLLTYSESIVGGTGTWIANSSTITANNVAGPTGTLTASRIVADGTTINQGIYNNQSTAAAGTVATFTIWLRGNVGGEEIQIGDASSRQTVTLTTAWQRLTNAGHTLANNNQVVYAKASTAMTFYAWGAQINLGSTALAYIPTTTAAVYAPAIAHDGTAWGVQSEAASTNWLLWNTKYANAAWTKSNCTATDDATTAPDGTTTACTLTATGANATCKQGVSTTAVLWTFSVFLRRKTGTGNVDITMDGSTWVTQTISAGAWTRCIVTQTGVAGTSNPGIRLVTSGDEVWVWAAQAE